MNFPARGLEVPFEQHQTSQAVDGMFCPSMWASKTMLPEAIMPKHSQCLSCSRVIFGSSLPFAVLPT